MKHIVAIFLFLFIGLSSLMAQTESFGTWIELEFTKKFLKDFEISFIPDIRLQDDFTVDKYQFDAKLGYEPFKFLAFSAAYRVKTNVKDKGNVVTNRFVFDASAKTELGRFEPSFRARYTNHDDEDEVKVTYIRPRLKVAYDIKGNKIKPYTSYEIFYETGEGELTKSRFDLGFTRKLGDIHRVGLYYRLQAYTSKRNSINILGIDYRLKF